jgi:hypothetical protein
MITSLFVCYVKLKKSINSVVGEPEGSSSYSQEPAIGPYHKPTESTPHPPANLRRSVLNPFSHTCLGLRNVPFPSRFPTKTVHFPLISQACHMPRPSRNLRYNNWEYAYANGFGSSTCYCHWREHEPVRRFVLDKKLSGWMDVLELNPEGWEVSPAWGSMIRGRRSCHFSSYTLHLPYN